MAPPPFATFTTTEVNKSAAKVWDEVWQKGRVEITRRRQCFVILRKDYLDKMVEEARDNRPESLEDLLEGYDADKIRTLTRRFMDDAPAGRERI